MKNIKKYTLIGTLGIVAIVLVMLIATQFETPSATDDIPADNNGQIGDITINSDNDNESDTSAESTTKPEMVINPILNEQPTNQPADDYTGTEQKIGPDPVKPEPPEKPDPPANTELTDPDKKPDDVKATSTPTQPTEPKGGETSDKGQTYFPGFGWVDGTGDSKGTKAEDMYENGNKIGNMD